MTPRLTYEIVGARQAQDALNRLSDRTKRHVAQAVNTAGVVVERGVKDQIRQGRPRGRWYRVPGHNKRYQASAEGQPPAVATGTLFGSIRTRRGLAGSNEMLAEVVAGVGYALPLEHGTKDGRIKPRPFVAPGVEDTNARATAIIAQAVREGLKE